MLWELSDEELDSVQGLTNGWPNVMVGSDKENEDLDDKYVAPDGSGGWDNGIGVDRDVCI